VCAQAGNVNTGACDDLTAVGAAARRAEAWLHVPYDSGYAFFAHPEVHATAMAYTAAYLTGQGPGRDFGAGDFTPESSRRARGFATWAALRSLGRSGVRDLVDRCCSLARRVAERLGALENVEVVNDVVLNQVLVRVGNAATVEQVVKRLQGEGVCWLGATTWRGERLLRISVSNWLTTEADVDQTVRAIRRALDMS
jgi:glutamate/tyrosine decarboxylase-like PLP-dependent enzyme